MKYEVAGDPVSGLRWTRKTTKKIAAELSALGIRVSRKTVAKLLKQMNFSLRTNKKKISNGSPPTRDAQFANITQLRERFSRRGNPILSVDTKKKELVGRFKNPGRVWAQKSDAVNDHDFRSMADGVAIPYGIYDLQSNRGTVYVGTSYDTSQFAVECIEKWWRSEGQKRFPGRKHLLVVADTGGSNGSMEHFWTRAPGDRRQNPYLFFKPSRIVIADGEPILMKPQREQLDWECEFAVVIGKPASHVPLEKAREHVFGYTIMNDVGDREGRGDNRYGSDWLV